MCVWGDSFSSLQASLQVRPGVSTSHEGPSLYSLLPTRAQPSLPLRLSCPRLGGEVIERGQEVVRLLKEMGGCWGTLTLWWHTLAVPLCFKIAGVPREHSLWRDLCQRLSQDRAEGAS